MRYRTMYVVMVYALVISLLSSQGFCENSVEYSKAQYYLSDEQGGEVYFSFILKDDSVLGKLSSIISIDNIEVNTVYAYANKDEFVQFLTYGIEYEILTPPGDLLNHCMSDYSDPSTRSSIDKYPTWQGFVTLMEGFAKEYPDLCKVEEIGKSVNKKQILVATISAKVHEKAPKPAFYSTGNIHGDETEGIVLSLKMIQHLLTNYGKDEQVTKLLDKTVLCLIPLLNPDGLYKGGDNTVTGAQRANANGKDLNRNYPDPVQGSPSSFEPETKASMEFESKHNFVYSIDFHGGTKMLLYPWSCKKDKHPDAEWYKYVMGIYSDSAKKNGITYAVGNSFVDLYEAHGTTKDYRSFFRHDKGCTMELYTTKTIPEKDFGTYWTANRGAFLAYIEQIHYGVNGFVKDSITGKGIVAKVYIENYDKDSSWVYSNENFGDFYRPIIKGTYSITFSANNYYPKTITSVAVENGKATVLDVKLVSKITQLNSVQSYNQPKIRFGVHAKHITISLADPQAHTQVCIFSPNGRRVVTLVQNNGMFFWNGLNSDGLPVPSGCYIARIAVENRYYTYRFRIDL